MRVNLEPGPTRLLLAGLVKLPFRKQVFFGNVADLTGVTCAVDRQLDRATIHLKTPLVVKDDIKFMFYSSEVTSSV